MTIMFWGKRRPSHQPPTPKMAPVSLPYDHMPAPQWHRVPLMPTNALHERNSNTRPVSSKRNEQHQRQQSASGWHTDYERERKPKITSMPSDVMPGRVSRTPHPSFSRPPCDLPQAPTHRLRKPPVMDGATDEVVKPLKGILKQPKVSVDYDEIIKPVVPAPPPNDRGASSKPDKADHDFLKPPKSILKGGGHSYNATTGNRIEKSSSYAGHSSPGSYVPPTYNEAAPQHRSRNHSFSGREEPRRTLPLDKYTSLTHVMRVVQKEEAIALSWPLTTSGGSGRKRYPLVYFDIWFNPRFDPSAVKVYVNGYFQNLSDGDRNLPASSHCTVTEMDITCPILHTSFVIKVRRPDGIRCIDVFQEIFDAYDHRLSKEEQRILAPEIDQRCMMAFQKRCRDAPHLPPVNERQGLRRVDLLRGKRIFDGLTRDPRSQTWILAFHRPGE